MAGEEILGNLNQPVMGPQAADESATLPSLAAPVPGQPSAEADEGKDVDVDVISAQFLKHWLQRTPPPPGEEGPAPGSFAAKLQSAVGQIGGGLSDAAAATETPITPGAPGGLVGVERTLKAGRERERQERKDAQENYEFRQRAAINNLQMAVHVENLKKMTQEARDASDAAGLMYSKSKEENGFDVRHGMTEDQVKIEMSKYSDDQGRHYGEVYDLIPVKHVTVNGKRSVIYDRITKQGRNYAPTSEELQYLRDHGVKDIPDGTKEVPYESYKAYYNQARSVDLMSQQFKMANMDARTLEQKQKTAEASQNAHVMNGMSFDPANPIAGLQHEQKYIDGLLAQHQILADNLKQRKDLSPEAMNEAMKELQGNITELQQGKAAIDTVLNFGISEKEREDSRKAVEDREKARHEERIEELKLQQIQATAKQKAETTAEETDPAAEGLMGQDYLDFLQKARPDDWGTVKQIGEGRAIMPGRLSKDGRKIWNMVNRAYPDWNQTLGKEWPNQWKEYMVSGKNSVTVTAYNALFRHMAELYDHTTGVGLIRGTDAYNQRQVDIGHVKEELARSLSNGVMAESDKKEFEDKLIGGLLETPDKKRKRIIEAARLARDRMEEIQTRFEKAKPSDAIKVPNLISDKGQIAFDYVISGGATKKPEVYVPGQEPTVPADHTPAPKSTPPPAPAPAATQSAPTGAALKKDIITQGGRRYLVTKRDASGKATAATEVDAQGNPVTAGK